MIFQYAVKQLVFLLRKLNGILIKSYGKMGPDMTLCLAEQDQF